MVQYTEAFLASARHGYENTDQPMRELARELGIGITTLSTLAEKNGWAKRSQRRRGLPPAMQLLAEAQALAAESPAHSRAGGNPENAEQQAREELGPRFPPSLALRRAQASARRSPLAKTGRGDERSESEPADAVDAAEPRSLLDRMEQILEQLIAAEEAAPANGIRSPHSARTLATLIQAMRALKGMRGPGPADTGPIEDDNDMPRDIDEFRHALARRIEAFVASHADDEDAGENAGTAVVDAAG